ncbi:MAG: methyltransferase domain protein [Verrucomicrobiaceae bacterium]|nr:methyltransferase domain protein [Verrucomicrobiaceae bacterium]
MNNLKKKNIVIVLGMHRSGTSAITRCLELFGIGLGENLQPANFDNPKGFWEDRECLQINEELLSHLGSAYDQLGLLPDRLANDSCISDLKIRASQIVLKKVDKNGGSWGFKDPRSCRLVPFWKEVIGSAGFEATYIIALRNPLSVAASLRTRNNIPYEKSYFLWLQHMLPALRETRDARRLIIDFDLLLDNPMRELQRISSHLGLPQTDIENPAVKAYMDEFLDKQLSHTRFSLNDLKLDSRAPSDVVATYQLLHSSAQDAVDADELRTLTETLYKRLEDFAPAFDYSNQLEEERASLYTSIVNQEGRIAALNQQIADINKQVADLYAGIGVRDGQIATLHQGVIERDSQIAQLHQEVIERDGVISSTHLTVSERDKIVSELHTEIVDLNAQIAKLQRSEFINQREIEQLKESIEKRESRSFELSQLVDEHKTLAQDLQTSLADLQDQIHQLTANIAQRENDLVTLANHVADHESRARNHTTLLAERDRQVGDRNISLAESESELATLTQYLAESKALTRNLITTLAERDQAIHELGANLIALKDEIATQEKNMIDREIAADLLKAQISNQEKLISTSKDINNQQLAEIEKLQRIVLQLNENIFTVLSSRSWRITSPFRALRRLPNKASSSIRKTTSDTARSLWRRSPIRTETKLTLKHSLFKNLPFIFSRTVAYRDWKAFESFSPDIARPHHQLSAPSMPHSTADRQPALVRLIAFYLPQFHPIPENDEWWGKGFTEWTNVTRAKPQFVGHYQPHIPADLGFYDLRVADVQRQQVALAKEYGLGGFCFYFYWFGGQRLLETPIKQYLDNPALDLPFCLCWANENWSRRWNGLDQDILIGQNHSAEDDEAFIEYISSYLLDPRYIRIDGKPLLLVYRPSLLPSAKETAERWRNWCRQNGLGEIYLAYTQSFETADPKNYGFDAAIEFPPNNSAPPVVTNEVEIIDEGFSGIVYDWKVFVERSRSYTAPSYTLFRSVCPSWDNTARRPNGGAVFLNSSPELYQEWLSNACKDTITRFSNPDERIIFANAWNEWAEGAHLEPDQQYGHAWLEATRNALVNQSDDQNLRRIIVVTHDAYPHGAQLLALNIARNLSESFGFSVETICLGDGPLKDQFAQIGTFHDLAGVDQQGNEAKELALNLQKCGFKSAIVNTTVAGKFLQTLHYAGFRCVSLIHELAGVIQSNSLEENARIIGQFADKIVFPAEQVRQSFETFSSIEECRAVVRPQGVYKKNRLLNSRQDSREILRQRLGLPQSAKIVIGVGFADHRKGIDLFVETCLKTAETDNSVHFVWVGHWHAAMRGKIDHLRDTNPDIKANFHPVGLIEDTDLYYAGADLYALTSREDPFPSVVLEAMDAGLPIVSFAEVTGCDQAVIRIGGELVKAFDVDSFSEKIIGILRDSDKQLEIGNAGKLLIQKEFSFSRYLFDLLGFANHALKRVSVIVPNYNYARYIQSRLQSILNQTYPIYELIILDDCSNDDSDEKIRAFLENCPIAAKYIRNTSNSGSVFAQWRKGVELATGDYVWIAEADDLAEPEFVETTLSGFEDPSVVLSYCESKQVDGNGNLITGNYHAYVSDLGVEHWQNAYTNDGHSEIQNFLSIKNTIPNVSAVLMRRENLHRVLIEHYEDISKYRIAGDWKAYLYLLDGQRLAYTPSALNLHRRHDGSVTISSFGKSQLDEITEIQQWATKKYKCEASTMLKIECYVKQLCTQFNIESSL